jgi:hypothetical protein
MTRHTLLTQRDSFTANSITVTPGLPQQLVVRNAKMNGRKTRSTEKIEIKLHALVQHQMETTKHSKCCFSCKASEYFSTCYLTGWSNEICKRSKPVCVYSQSFHKITVRGLKLRKKLICNYVRFEVFTAITMKNAVFCDVTSCGFC